MDVKCRPVLPCWSLMRHMLHVFLDHLASALFARFLHRKLIFPLVSKLYSLDIFE